MAKPKLKPCPFCGSKTIYISEVHYEVECSRYTSEVHYEVECSRCLVMMKSYTLENAIKKWNTRATRTDREAGR